MLQLTDFIIDCPDTMKLPAFYSAVTGRTVKEGSDENWVGIQFGEIELAFIRVEGLPRPPVARQRAPQAIPPRLRSR